jgi:hypothetical protein
MKYKVLITPVAPSVATHPNFTGVLADYEVDANSESEAGDLAFDRFCQENPFPVSREGAMLVSTFFYLFYLFYL